MSRPDLAREIDAVARHLVLLAALPENLAHSLRTPQDGAAPEADALIVPVTAHAYAGKGNAAAPRRARTGGDLPAPAKRWRDGRRRS